MATITITPGTLTNYRDTTVWTEENYLGWIYESGASTPRYRVKLKLTLSKSVNSIKVKTDWPDHTSMSLSYAYNAAMTQSNGNTPPSSADTTFYFNQDNLTAGEFTINKKMAAGTWYLWLWYTGSNYNFVRGTPTWTITGETANAVHVYSGGEWKEATPYVYSGGEWKEATPYVYSNGWKETG